MENLLKDIELGKNVLANTKEAKTIALAQKNDAIGKIARKVFQAAGLFFLKQGPLLAELCTGFGKSKIGVDATKFEDVHKTLIVISKNNHKDTWIKEFVVWNTIADVDYINYRSLHKVENNKYDLIIYDECHNITPNNFQYIKKLTPKYSLFLSGSVYPEHLKMMLELGIKRIKISLKEAMTMKVIPSVEVFLVPVVIPNTKAEYLFELKRNNADTEQYPYRKMEYAIKRYYQGKNVHINCTAIEYDWVIKYMIKHYAMKAYAIEQSMKNNEASESDIKYRGYLLTLIKRLGLDRANFYANLKVEKAKELIQSFKDNRTIVYCSGIPMAEEFSQLGFGKAIHSEMENAETIATDFDNKKFNHVYTVKMYDESRNLVDMEKGIIVQLHKRRISGKQRTGRIVRAKFPELYIFYCQGSSDEDQVVKFCKEEDFDFEILTF